MQKLAQLTVPGFDEPILPPPGIPTGSFTDGVGNTILANSLNAAFVIAVILSLAYLLWGGIQWIMSEGDKQKIAAARSKLMYAIIGLVVIALAIPLINFVSAFFGAPQLGEGFSSLPTCTSGQFAVRGGERMCNCPQGYTLGDTFESGGEPVRACVNPNAAG